MASHLVSQRCRDHSLKCRRDICRVAMFFRILHDEISIPSHHLPIPITSCTRGHSHRFRQFPAHLRVSFFPATTRIWKNLPVSAIEARNIDGFKQRIVENFCINSAID